MKKLQQQKNGKAYEEVYNQGQEYIFLRWVIKEKLVDNEKLVKARLCAQKVFQRLQKCEYVFADTKRFWYQKLKEEHIRLGATPSTLDKDKFVWIRNKWLMAYLYAL